MNHPCVAKVGWCAVIAGVIQNEYRRQLAYRDGDASQHATNGRAFAACRRIRRSLCLLLVRWHHAEQVAAAAATDGSPRAAEIPGKVRY